MKKMVLFLIVAGHGLSLFGQEEMNRCQAIRRFAVAFGETKSTVWGNVNALIKCGANEQDIYMAMAAFLEEYNRGAFWIREKRQGGYNGITAPDLISGFLTILYDQGKPRSFYHGKLFFGPHLAIAKRVAPAMHKNWHLTSDQVFADLPKLRREVQTCQ